MTKTRELAQFVNGLRYGDLPEPVIAKAKEIVLNTWGVQLATSTLPWTKLVYRFVRSQGGVAESTVVNYGLRTSAAYAAYVNGTFAHAFEMDDNHTRSGVKAGAVAVPTALAVGEQQLASGKDLIVSMVAGFEIMHRIGLAIRPGLVERGGHPTGNSGVFGAAAIAGKLLRLDETTLMYALGSAGTNIHGLSEIPAEGRGHIKRTFGGAASFSGIRAAFLAREGLTGPETTLDGDASWGSFSRMFHVGEDRVHMLTDGLGSEWETLRVHYKIYAQDGFIQPMTQALEQIRKEHTFRAEDIDEVWIGTNKHAHDNVIGPIREPKDLTDAQFSATFSVAQYLVVGGAGFHAYTEENLSNPLIRDLSRRVVVEVDDEIEQEYIKSSPRGAKVTIRLKSGEELKARVDSLREMTPDDLDEKFRTNSTVVLDHDRSERLLDSIHHLEDVRDLSMIAPMLVR